MNSSALILNVNDREVPRYVTDEILRRAGFETRAAASGAQALDLILSCAPDLVLLDIQLPDVDGFEVCRRIKANPLTAHIPVLLTSAAFVSSRSKTQGLDLGADGYLVQPFEPAELIATVRALLRMRQAEKEAKEALRLRDAFVAVASHELRTPVAALSLQLELLMHRQQAPLDEAVRKRLTRARRGVKQLEKLIAGLLDFARLDGGRVPLHAESFDLSDVVRSAVEDLREQAESAGSGITLHLDEVVGSWDRIRIEHVVANLLGNAVKYGAGSPIEVSVSAEQDWCELMVRDGGGGIAPEDHSRIFERFERTNVDPVRTGFGLGLWIARESSRALGGDITVESALGQGSTFTLRLPLAMPVSEALKELG